MSGLFEKLDANKWRSGKRAKALGEAVGMAVIDRKFPALHAQLAPWLQAEVSAKDLKKIFELAAEDSRPADFVLCGNESTLDDLQEASEDASREDDDDEPMTLKTWDGELNEPPSFSIPEEITEENFRQWMFLEFAPDDEGDEDLDSAFVLYFVVVEIEGKLKIGYLEPGASS